MMIRTNHQHDGTNQEAKLDKIDTPALIPVQITVSKSVQRYHKDG
ncbi:hypothetical protein WBJ53_19600 [Spirosoma sp. SC4-14]